MSEAPPRLVVAGAGGGSGKTLVALGLVAAWRTAGLAVAAFKKGPDYIDAAWLSRAAGRPARNLDEWMMGSDGVRRSFGLGAEGADVCVVEGNRGILDGYQGHSTAALAEALAAPVVLVLDVTKVTRTAAAAVAGVKAIAPDLRLAGVVANRVGGARHGREVKKAIEEITGVPVVGRIPRLTGENPLPDRHLGLVPPEEHGRMDEVTRRLAGVIREHCDVETLFGFASACGPLDLPPPVPPGRDRGARVRIGVFRDSAFTFYYPENIEALERAGGEIVPVSAFEDPHLPDVQGLYIGGGFPETQAEALSRNRSLLFSVREAARRGLPIYAECGGLVYLSRSVTHRGRRWPMAGVFGVDVEVLDRPQGHGYAEMTVDRENPFFARGSRLRGHEFHYSRIVSGAESVDFALGVRRGTGVEGGRDGLHRDRVFATWLHLHASGAPEWAPALAALAGAECAVPGAAASPSSPPRESEV